MPTLNEKESAENMEKIILSLLENKEKTTTNTNNKFNWIIFVLWTPWKLREKQTGKLTFVFVVCLRYGLALISLCYAVFSTTHVECGRER